MNVDLKSKVLIEIENSIRTVQDSNPDLYKAYPHRFTLGATLNEGEILEFERKFNITLPSDYRAYLKEIGNGGTHGILPLKDVLKRRYPNGNSPSNYLSNEFSMDKSITEECLKEVGYFNYSEKEKEEYWLNNLRGTIDIRDVACGEFDTLVVSGNRKGELWSDVMYADIGLYRTTRTFWDLIF